MKTAKIYCTRQELADLAPSAKLVESYDAFQLVEISPAVLKKVAAKLPVEDVSGQFKVRMAGKAVDTSRPRYSAKGKVLAHRAYSGAAKLKAGKHHYLVQFIGPVRQAWQRQVKKAGGEFRGHYADFTSIFRLSAAALGKVQALPFVRWVGHMSHEARIASDVKKRPAPALSAPQVARGPALVTDGPGARKKRSTALRDMLVIQFFDGKDMKAALPGIKRAGAETVGTEKTGLAIVRVPQAAAARKKAVASLSALHGVRLISTYVVPTACNDVAARLMVTKKTLAAPSPAVPGLSGNGEIIAVADTGLDTGVAATVMPDFAGRVAGIRSWPINAGFNPYITNPGGDDGAADVDSGHGTHVAGSVLGGGSPAVPAVRGLSSKARLFFQAVEQKLQLNAQGRQAFRNDPFQLAGLPNDLKKLFDQAYAAGARIHSNSWGGGDPGEYASTSRQLDEYVWKNQDFCVIVAAGNEGVDANADGVVDEGSMSSPGTAKNCITVGASQSLRNFPQATWGAFWPSDFPAPPLSVEKVAGDADKMAAFSSRGPTVDQRVKPDVVAPGTFILSTRSTQITGTGWAPFSNARYMYDGGTSMATPLVAGAVGLLREFFRTRQGTASPSAALLKAALICGATRMPLSYVPAGRLFDNHQGFGRVNLDAITAPKGGRKFGFQDAAVGLVTGEVSEVSITAAAGRPLRIVLAYSDFPGRGLKNNLNLLLIGPDGSRHVGNATGGQLTFDSKNNVEVIEVAAPSAGAWRVQVLASNVPMGPQRYALAWLA